MADDTSTKAIWNAAYARFMEFLKDKPTGSFSVKIPVNQGGVRRPEYEIKEKG